jgi:FkbM family methyltransferase
MTANSEHAPMTKTSDIWSTALRGIPAFPGKVRVTDALARIAAIVGSSWGTCSLGNGATIRMNLSDRIERQMWGGCYERYVQQSLRALLAPGDVFIDIGAHVGYHAVLGASVVGSRGRVFAFEADPKNFVRLEDHLHPFPWGTAVNKAVWSATGNVIFERSSQPGESGWGTLTTVRDLARGVHFSVDTVSLDDWSLENEIRTVSVMKVDAEGSEVSILRGAKGFLQRTRPGVIIEANDVLLRQAKTSALELTEILRGDGYELFELDATLQPVRAGMSPRCSEVLAVPVERIEGTLVRLQQSGFPAATYRSAHGSIR